MSTFKVAHVGKVCGVYTVLVSLPEHNGTDTAITFRTGPAWRARFKPLVKAAWSVCVAPWFVLWMLGLAEQPTELVVFGELAEPLWIEEEGEGG